MGSGQPLAGLRVIDLGTRIAAPFCAGLLGEMGAEVIKIEQPGTGDFMREIGPFQDGQSMFWSVEGRGRKSVTIDLRKPEGQDLFRRLAATADVVVENFRPGTLEGWNIAPAQLDPRLVIVRISVFGQDGPSSLRPGLDRLGIGYGGLLHVTGYPDRPPVRVGITISDYLTGIFSAHAAVAALYERDARGTGEGSVIDAFLYGGVLRILEWTFVAYDKLGLVRGREGNTIPNSVPIDNYPTADGKFVCIVAGSDQNFRRLARAMEREDLITDPRYATLPARVERHAEVNGLVADWTRTLTTAEIEERCIAQDVPVGTAYTAADIFADPHMQARGDLITVDDPVLGPVKQQAPFPRFIGAPPNVPTGAPTLGEHTDEVLGGILGLSESERAELREARII
jgi:crotonobetainyl-CoA:carnitine CoA-transferase CaiB-like acyl-CoA transferase